MENESRSLEFVTKVVDISILKEHPKNYRQHPDDQIEHLCKSITEHGIYKNIVVANDGTILTGHGVVKACRKLELKQIPVFELPIAPDDIKALKLLAADNELGHLAQIDDKALIELLKGVMDMDSLLGTGFDDKMLANLMFVSRPASEIKSINEAAEFLGMPEYDEGKLSLKLIVNFESEENRQEFAKLIGVELTEKTKYIYFPPVEKNDLKSVRFVEKEEAANVEEPKA